MARNGEEGGPKRGSLSVGDIVKTEKEGFPTFFMPIET